MTTRKTICPNCRKKEISEGDQYFPFCSQRCQTTDLGQWAAQQYRMPTNEIDDEAAIKDSEPE